MKKFLFGMFMMFACMSASAQQGEKAVGATLSYGTEIENLGVGVKGQYYFTDRFRGEASFDYFFKKNYLSMWDLNANLHYLIDLSDDWKVYPLAGLGYTNWTVSGIEIEGLKSSSASTGKIAVNLGGGIQYDLSERLKLNAELKYQIINNYNQVVLGVGFAYHL